MDLSVGQVLEIRPLLVLALAVLAWGLVLSSCSEEQGRRVGQFPCAHRLSCREKMLTWLHNAPLVASASLK